ncbi:MAG: spermidine synthase family protein, partial [Planctomycetota bacterium]
MASVFLVSFAVLAFEVGLTRIFAAMLSYHFAFLAVSAAVCGLGIGGFAWHLLGQRPGCTRPAAGWAALGFALSMPFTIFLLFGVASVLAAHPIAALLVILPFTFSGAFLADVFQQRAAESGRLYQADLAGAAIAAVLVVPLLGLSGALYLVFLLAGMAAAGAAAWACAHNNRRLFASSAAFGLLLFGLWPLGPRTNLFRVRPFVDPDLHVAKRMVSELADEHARPLVVDSEWTAYARTDLVRYP